MQTPSPPSLEGSAPAQQLILLRLMLQLDQIPRGTTAKQTWEARVGVLDLESHCPVGWSRLPEASSKLLSLPGPMPPTKSCGRAGEPGGLAEGGSDSCLRHLPGAVSPGWRLPPGCLHNRVLWKGFCWSAAGGTSRPCAGCAARSLPPFILLEVSALAGCPVHPPRRLLETCSQVLILPQLHHGHDRTIWPPVPFTNGGGASG